MNRRDVDEIVNAFEQSDFGVDVNYSGSTPSFRVIADEDSLGRAVDIYRKLGDRHMLGPWSSQMHRGQERYLKR